MSGSGTAPSLSPVFKEYEDGKRRRYELLFKVNGAAFAIVTLAAKVESAKFVDNIIDLRALAVGMMLFTLVMGLDIFAFGWGMKQVYTPADKVPLKFLPARWGPVTPLNSGLFRLVGMFVLIAIVALITVGWVFVAARAD